MGRQLLKVERNGRVIGKFDLERWRSRKIKEGMGG